MNIISGIMPLEPLHQYVKNQDPHGRSLHGKSHDGRIYGKHAKALTEQIAEMRGFYLWGTFGTEGKWKNIYVGRSRIGKTSHLRARVLEELKDEKHFLWRSIYSEDELLTIGRQHYPDMWFRYRNHWILALEKTGTTHIAWTATPDLTDEQVHDIEPYIIKELNPTANKKRPPTPPSPLEIFSTAIAMHFKQLTNVSS